MRDAQSVLNEHGLHQQLERPRTEQDSTVKDGGMGGGRPRPSPASSVHEVESASSWPSIGPELAPRYHFGFVSLLLAHI